MKPVLIILVFSVACIQTFSQSTWLPFKNLTEKQGLADVNIASIIKDRTGYLWFASSEGLNRFDGKHCKVYHHLNADSNSISDDNVNVLFEDSKRNLWIGTRNGLNLYNPIEDNFKRFLHNKADKNSTSSNEIWSIAEDSTGTLWIGTMGGGLNKLIMADDKYSFIHYKNDSAVATSLSNDIVWSIGFDAKGNGWVGTENGLNRFAVADAKDGGISFAHYVHNSSANSIAENSVWKLTIDDSNNIWLTSFYGMIDCLPYSQTNMQPDEASFIHIQPLLESELNYLKFYAMACMQDKSNTFWIGTDNAGMIRCKISIDQKKLKAGISDVCYFTRDESDEKSIIHNAVYTVYQDPIGLIWAGTANGVSMYSPDKKMFDVLEFNKNDPLRSTTIRFLYHYNEHPLFVTGDNEVHLLDRLNSSIRKLIGFEKPSEISFLYKCLNGDLLIGLSATSSLYLIKGNDITNAIGGRANTVQASLLHLPENLASASIFFVSEREPNEFITGGYDRLGMLDLKNNSYNSLLDENSLSKHIFRCIAEGKLKYYIGTDNGLFVLDRTTQKLQAFSASSKLSADRITSLLLHDEKLWIGTNSGLNVYDLKTDSMLNFFRQDGLPDNHISSLCTDDENNIWIATRNGLSMYDPVDNLFSSFNENEGLNSNQLNFISCHNNILYIASDKGINTVIPSSLKNTSHAAGIALTDFRIAGHSLFNYPVSKAGKNLRLGKPVRISWRENNISIEFNALNYKNPDAIQYAYILEDFDKDWVYSSNMSRANYTNLPGGKYRFRVKYAANDGKWMEPVISIPVYVSTAWYNTWWFYLGCTLLISAVIYSLYRIRLKRIVELQNVRNKIARDLHDDIGSTLSTINILSSSAIKKLNGHDQPAEQALKKIADSSDKMMEVMRDIVWSINPDNDELEDIVVRMREYAGRILDPKNISYTIAANEQLMNTKLPLAKRRDFYLVFKESVNNLAKYSDADNVEIFMTIQSNYLELIVKDNGKGFDASIVSEGNGLKNMKQRAYAMGGNLEISRTKTGGTQVFLVVPLG